jgi:hypothetical protein
MNIKKEKPLVFFGVFMIFIILSGKIGTADSWLSFWGTWLGAIFGGFITIIGIYFTLESSNKQFEQSLKEQRESYESDRDLNLMPHIKAVIVNNKYADPENVIIFTNTKINGDKYTGISVELKNIGLGSATNLKVFVENQLGECQYYENIKHKIDLGVNEIVIIYLSFYGDKIDTYSIKIKYNDLIGKNIYIQEGKLINRNKAFNLVIESTKKEKIF